MTVFLDTSALVAFAYEQDQFHSQANKEFSRLHLNRIKLCTTNYTVDETLTYLLKRIGYQATVALGDTLFAHTAAQVYRVTHQQELTAWEIFKQYNQDKYWSFTDCISFVVMKSLRLKQVFTFDQHFSQMGFELLPAT